MSSTSTTLPATPVPTPTINPAFEVQLIKSVNLVWHVNLFLYAIVAVVFVLRIPHIIGLFGTSAEWYNGHFFRYVRPRKTKAARAREKAARAMQRNDSARTVVGDDPDTGYYPKALTREPSRRHGRTVGELKKPFLFPAHVPAVARPFRTILALSRTRGLVPGYSAGQLLMLLGYFVVLLYTTLYRSNPFTDATRPAWVAVAQIPLVLLLAQKNSIPGWLLGYGYERLNFIHRFVGRLVVLGSNLHALFYVYRWTAAGTFTRIVASPKNAWGMVMLVAIDVLYFFSIPFFRQKAYNLFIWSHTIAVILLLPAIYLHQPSLWIYAVTSAVIYAFDRVFRLAKTRIATAVLTPHSSEDVVRVQVSTINAGWRAGQHVRLRVLSFGGHMGLFGWTEVHPFTIASASGCPEGLALVIKKSGDWTGNLSELARGRRDAEKTFNYGVPVRVWLEGPYGGCGRTVFSSFCAAVIICGGSGISFGLSLLHDLVAKDGVAESRLKYVELVWVVPEQRSMDDAAMEELVGLVDEANFNRSRHGHGRMEMKVGVWFTRAATSVGTERFKGVLVSLAKQQSTSSEDGDLDLEDVDVTTRPVGVHPNVIVSPGRPRFGRSLDTAISKGVALRPGDEEEDGMKGLIVGVCGPTEMGEEVVRAVNAIGSDRRDKVGGIEVHEETFGM